ncbi:uncharacterized protein MONOS_15265 [Monocercomonoides exilis]|uniref:uncharacterized protein n=1 Tax=Monocercomonoides exilis TaxID=2049356 RepID=UPI00355994EE|nr:hypothetical protein MONOS_15265 [Monocercomonoides exilis]|eukprot:MONOS_15265.1-p1 / transcript=MONOS_15265.1 / gene=MONOS_15265 / organism=Monocercomonoides_exilis_PA203 / gene_product=unspecified product / transcript_product=unspecified product / location=Mono_scaffold01184:7023-9779(+) / protein_length=796 / sequence_SO=supercontig / SO=protein_coding / is_pseudo=false
MDTTEGQSFSLCEWVDCTAPQGGALYVHENENAILTVENSSFLRCNASSTFGGGIFALNIAECLVQHTTFVQCEAYEAIDCGGGGIMIENVNFQSMVEDCYFQNCSSGNDGGAIDLRPTKTQRQKKCIINSFFDNCQSNEAASGGHDIYLSGSSENNIDPSCYSTRQTKNRVVTYHEPITDKSEWLNNAGGRIRFVSTVQTQPHAMDAFVCGINESYPCCTISHCLTQLIPEFVKDIKILTGTIIVTKNVDCGADGLSIYGQRNSTTTVQTELEASGLSLFSVSAGTLTVNDLALVHDSACVNNRVSRIFEISGAEEMYVSKRATNGAAVMSFSNDKANIDLDSCTFDGCGSSSSENGGSIMLCVGNENEVKVKGGSFDGCFCSATYGLGGGIFLRLLNENPDFQISTSFSTNTAKWGNDIFIFSPNLEETAKSENITCVTDSLDSLEKVRGYDNGNTSVAIPLCIYLLNPEEIYVSNTEASDHSHCGIVQFPCLTLKHSLTRQTETKKIVVNGMVAMSDELTFSDQKHEIRGNDDQSGWTISDSSETSNSAMITASVETELSKLIFSLLTSSLSHRSTFISSSSSSMTLSQCTFSLQNPTSELTFLFLSVESGILNIDSFSTSSIDLRRNSLISLSGSGTRDELMNTLLLNMTNCTFPKIERAAGSGGCVSIDNSDDEDSNAEINIEECSFDGCSVLDDESRGGAINAHLKGSIQMDITSCTFTGCVTPAEEEKTGFGGGMALKLIDDDSSFVISSPVFNSEKPNAATFGNDLFVESPNLMKSITSTSLPFVTV